MIFWVAAGVIYLSAVDDWQVYAEPLERVKSWYEGVRQDFRQADVVRADKSNCGEAYRVRIRPQCPVGTISRSPAQMVRRLLRVRM